MKSDNSKELLGTSDNSKIFNFNESLNYLNSYRLDNNKNDNNIDINININKRINNTSNYLKKVKDLEEEKNFLEANKKKIQEKENINIKKEGEFLDDILKKYICSEGNKVDEPINLDTSNINEKKLQLLKHKNKKRKYKSKRKIIKNNDDDSYNIEEDLEDNSSEIDFISSSELKKIDNSESFNNSEEDVEEESDEVEEFLRKKRNKSIYRRKEEEEEKKLDSIKQQEILKQTDNEIDLNDEYSLNDFDLSDQKKKNTHRLIKNKDNKELALKLDEECLICLGNIDNLGNTNKCNHNFCRQCLFEWAKKASCCPVCKIPFDKIIVYEKGKKKYLELPSKELSDDNSQSVDVLYCFLCYKVIDGGRFITCKKCGNCCHIKCYKSKKKNMNKSWRNYKNNFDNKSWMCDDCIDYQIQKNKAKKDALKYII